MRCTSICIFSLVFNLTSIAHAPARPEAPGVTRPSGVPFRTYLNINNISTVFRANGISDIDAAESNAGFVYPKGTGKTAVYSTGLLWGGLVDGTLRIGGSFYRTGLQSGPILPGGTAGDPDAPANRVYRVRADVTPYESPQDSAADSFASELLDEGTTSAAIRAQYELDWEEWPAALGAPFEDVDGSGTYDPSIDVPGVPEAGQTIWFVCNDLDTNATRWLSGSDPMHVELQVTAWASNLPGALGNTIFRRYRLINGGNHAIDSMYLSLVSDADIGNSTDDFAGCDTTAGVGYVYNATATDAGYSPLPPPAAGFDLLQGPTVPSPGDSAASGGRWLRDRRNLPMTAFAYFARGDAVMNYPVYGTAGVPQWYNFFQGRVGTTGEIFTDPGLQQTRFALAGNPVAHSGWVDGQSIAMGDRGIALSSGPFTMAPADTQEIVVAEIAAGAVVGTDRLTAITLLKFYDTQVQLAFDQSILDVPREGSSAIAGLPETILLAQNYPNPFNPSTRIPFSLPSAAYVTLKVYDLLGREIAVLVRGQLAAGPHFADFNAGELPAGIYFCRLAVGADAATTKLSLVR